MKKNLVLLFTSVSLVALMGCGKARDLEGIWGPSGAECRNGAALDFTSLNKQALAGKPEVAGAEVAPEPFKVGRVELAISGTNLAMKTVTPGTKFSLQKTEEMNFLIESVEDHKVTLRKASQKITVGDSVEEVDFLNEKDPVRLTGTMEVKNNVLTLGGFQDLLSERSSAFASIADTASTNCGMAKGVNESTQQGVKKFVFNRR